MTILGKVMKGAVAGVVATAAMDAVWYRRYRSGGGSDSFADWEFSTSLEGFGDDAPAPAQVGKRIADIVGVELDDSRAGLTNNVVHWATGIGWGKFAGLATTVRILPPFGVGIGTGLVAFATSYVTLGAAGIYKPITEYDRVTLAKDLSAHLVFGATLGAALTAFRS